MTESSETTVAPSCPGCHFGCALDAYRCGRGKGFHKLWMNGEPVPERKVPPFMREGDGGKAPSGGPAMPLDARVMHGLNIMANILGDRHTESAERKALMAVGRQGGFFAASLLGKRTLLEDGPLDEAVAYLVEASLAERDEDEVAGAIVRITPAGREQLAVWDAERNAATAEFLSPLDDTEKEQLSALLSRIIQSELKKKHA